MSDTFPELVRALESADLAIGSRYVPGGSIPDWPRSRRFISVAGNRYVQVLTGMPVQDATAGFRAFRRTVAGINDEAGMITVSQERGWDPADTKAALDGWVARKRGSASTFGAVFDILGDRIVENALWVIFADLDQKNLVVGIAFMAVGFTFATRWE